MLAQTGSPPTWVRWKISVVVPQNDEGGARYSVLRAKWRQGWTDQGLSILVATQLIVRVLDQLDYSDAECKSSYDTPLALSIIGQLES